MMSNKLKRYTFRTVPVFGLFPVSENSQGHWVQYEDVKQLQSDLAAAQKELELAKTQTRCDLISGEPGHQKLLCDRLQEENERLKGQLRQAVAIIEAGK